MGGNMQQHFFRRNLSYYCMYPSLMYLSKLVLAYAMLLVKTRNGCFHN